MYSNGYLFSNFRENNFRHNIIQKYVESNNNEIKRNHLSCIFNTFDKNLIKLKFSFFLKLINIHDNFIIVDDFK